LIDSIQQQDHLNPPPTNSSHNNSNDFPTNLSESITLQDHYYHSLKQPKNNYQTKLKKNTLGNYLTNIPKCSSIGSKSNLTGNSKFIPSNFGKKAGQKIRLGNGLEIMGVKGMSNGGSSVGSGGEGFVGGGVSTDHTNGGYFKGSGNGSDGCFDDGGSTLWSKGGSEQILNVKIDIAGLSNKVAQSIDKNQERYLNPKYF
jgi:hypothetical protein